MAAFDTTRPDLSGFRFGASISHMIGTFASWNDARKTRNALSKLSTHELEDIGLSRGDVEAVGYNHLIR